MWQQSTIFGYFSYPLCLGSSSCLFLHIFLSMFVKQLLLSFCQISPLLSSPLFCRWWNCLSPYIIWNMSWWSRTCEELRIISSHPYITFSSLLCYDALMLQVQDQMMIGMFLRPLLLLLLVFFDILLFYRTTLFYRPLLFLIPSHVPKAHFLTSIRTKHEIMSRTPDSAARCPEHNEQPTLEEQALEDQITQE